MKAPGFWHGPPGLAAALLRPLAEPIGRHVAARMDRPGWRAGVPVLCVGNFTAGGAGKTPLALCLAAMLREAGEAPVFLTRGYGGREAGPYRVGLGDTAERVGDEPLLLSEAAPTIVARDRPAGAAAAEAVGGVIVMDDGFQNPSLAKDCSILVVDGSAGIGNGLTLPAGPLRAPIHAQMPHASAVVVVGPGRAAGPVATFARESGKPVFAARLVPETTELDGRRVLAFSGIAVPEKFLATLRELGAEVVASRAFPDHHAYTEREAAGLAMLAQREGLLPVTTAKDWVRLAGGPARHALASLVRVVPVRLVPDDPAGLWRLVAEAIAERRARRG